MGSTPAKKAQQTKSPDLGSNKRLVEKLGIKAGMKCCVLNAPENLPQLLGDLPPLVEISSTIELASYYHVFVNTLSHLQRDVSNINNAMMPDSMIWISWYKKSAKLPTELNENLIRYYVLSLGLVDVKVCSVSEQWSALKCVRRRALR